MATDAKIQADERIAVSLKTLVGLAHSAALLKLDHGRIKSQQSGGYLSGFTGRGMEFDETRLYQPGDDIRSIDWRVTARTGKTHTKLFREERERPVFISVDYSPSMHFATRGVFKSVQAAKLAALLAWTAQFHGDRVGGQIYSGCACREFKPFNGKHAVLRFLNGLAAPIEATENRAIDFHHAIARLTRHVRPGSLVYLISDFRKLDESAEIYLSKLSQHCDVIMIEIHDPLESNLPSKGRYRFTNKNHDVTVDASEKQKRLVYQNRFKRRQNRLMGLAIKFSIGFIQCSTIDNIKQMLSELNRSSRLF